MKPIIRYCTLLSALLLLTLLLLSCLFGCQSAPKLTLLSAHEGETVPLDFDIERKITPEEVRALEDRARETLLNGIVNDWVGAILPNK